MSSVPPTKPSPEPQRSRGSWASILFMSLLGMAMFAGLAMLTLGIMPQVLILGGAMMLFAGLNYAIWGWWLPKVLPKDNQDEERMEK